MAETSGRFSALKILLVEDQAESRALLKNILAELGITNVFEAEDGRVALQFIDSLFDPVDLILCDWNMPAMSGIEFLRQVRSTGSKTPFMMITGRSDHASVIEARNLGVDGYIRKPFSPTQIEAKLIIVLHRLNAA